MEYVVIQTGKGTAKRLPIPDDIVNASDDRSAILTYCKSPPKDALAAAESFTVDAPAAPASLSDEE